MPKLASEGQFGAALRAVDLDVVVFKPGDDMRNRKPCDFMVWYVDGGALLSDTPNRAAVSTWFEVKDVDAVETFPLAELRPSQLQGIRDAERVGIPYFLAVYWRRHRTWTISDAVKLLAATQGLITIRKSVRRSVLASRFGIDSSPGQLSSTLKAVLLGDLD